MKLSQRMSLRTFKAVFVRMSGAEIAAAAAAAAEADVAAAKKAGEGQYKSRHISNKLRSYSQNARTMRARQPWSNRCPKVTLFLWMCHLY